MTEDIKMPVVKDLMKVHYNRIDKEIWLQNIANFQKFHTISRMLRKYAYANII